jgi:hypothetical protein
MPVFLSTDIMVDTPDEQSIVTYVAQFLERFPELEPVCWFSFNSENVHSHPLAISWDLACVSLCGNDTQTQQRQSQTDLEFLAFPHFNF